MEDNSQELNKRSMVKQWNVINEKIKILKKEAEELKELIISTYYEEGKLGTQNHLLDDGCKLTIVSKNNYKVSDDASAIEEVLAQLDENTAERLINKKYTLVKPEYDRLTEEDRKIVDSIVTITPSTPTLAIKEPKK